MVKAAEHGYISDCRMTRTGGASQHIMCQGHSVEPDVCGGPKTGSFFAYVKKRSTRNAKPAAQFIHFHLDKWVVSVLLEHTPDFCFRRLGRHLLFPQTFDGRGGGMNLSTE